MSFAPQRMLVNTSIKHLDCFAMLLDCSKNIPNLMTVCMARSNEFRGNYDVPSIYLQSDPVVLQMMEYMPQWRSPLSYMVGWLCIHAGMASRPLIRWPAHAIKVQCGMEMCQLVNVRKKHEPPHGDLGSRENGSKLNMGQGAWGRQHGSRKTTECTEHWKFCYRVGEKQFREYGSERHQNPPAQCRGSNMAWKK